MARQNRLPSGVKFRFPNQSGAPVDVFGIASMHWRCGGCPAGEGYYNLAPDEAARQAQSHASRCTGLPKSGR